MHIRRRLTLLHRRELHSIATRVHHLIPLDHVRVRRRHIQIHRAVQRHQEVRIPRPTGDDERRQGGEPQAAVLVEQVHPDEVGARVRDEEELARRVGDGEVGHGLRELAHGVDGFFGEVVGLGLDELEGLGF